MTKIAVVYHSGYGHTAKLAEAVHAGAAELADTTILPISAEGELPEGGWDTIAAADGVIFGSPTYMGGPSWQFKKFADASSKPWFGQAWRDKVAGGFHQQRLAQWRQGFDHRLPDYAGDAAEHGLGRARPDAGQHEGQRARTTSIAWAAIRARSRPRRRIAGRTSIRTPVTVRRAVCSGRRVAETAARSCGADRRQPPLGVRG